MNRDERIVYEVQQLRKRHPHWWIWHSSNVGFEGFYGQHADSGEKLHGSTSQELTERIRRAG